VDQIARTGDLDSVLFYLDKFVTANLTEEDRSEKFGTAASVNAFTILQLGADYLRDRHQELSEELARPEQSAAEQFRRRKDEFEETRAKAFRALEDRDARIKELRQQLAKEEEKAKKLKALLHRARQKVKDRERSSPRTKIKRTETDSEPGAIDDDNYGQTRSPTSTRLPAARSAEEEELSEGQVPLRRLRAGSADVRQPVIEEEDDGDA
jgi:chromosome segregation ATPase